MHLLMFSSTTTLISFRFETSHYSLSRQCGTFQNLGTFFCQLFCLRGKEQANNGTECEGGTMKIILMND